MRSEKLLIFNYFTYCLNLRIAKLTITTRITTGIRAVTVSPTPDFAAVEILLTMDDTVVSSANIKVGFTIQNSFLFNLKDYV